MPRKSKEVAAPTIGFFGLGEMPSGKIISELLDEYFIGKKYASVNDAGEISFVEGITFIIPATKERYTDALTEVVAYATESDIDYEIVHDEASAKARPIAAAIKGASKVHKVARIGSKLAAELTKRDNPLLVAVWADDDDELAKVVNVVREAEVAIRDLTLDMEEVDFTEQEDAPDEGESQIADDTEPTEADEQPFTAEELEDTDLEDTEEDGVKYAGLKTLAKKAHLEVPPRSRKPTYIKMLLEAQAQKAAEADIATGGDTAEGTGTLLEATGIDPEEIATAVLEALCGEGGPLQDIGEFLEGIQDAVNAIQAEQKELRQAIVDVHHTLNQQASKASAEEPEPEEEPEEKAPARRPVRRRAL